MGLNFEIFVLAIVASFLISLTDGLYIRKAIESHSSKTQNSYSNGNPLDEWSVLKQKLGLSNRKVELLKSQKDQQGTLNLLKRFIEENPNYSIEKGEEVEDSNAKPAKNDFWEVYENILKQLKLSRNVLKTSLNFELADRSGENLKRSPRKIAVKMVSDMPSEEIDGLLKMFNEKHGILNQSKDDDDNEEEDYASESTEDYSDFPSKLPSSRDPDYVYENLYEDAQDPAVSVKSNRNPQYGSLQDLIFQASKNQWKKEIEETKLRHRNNEHFI